MVIPAGLLGQNYWDDVKDKQDSYGFSSIETGLLPAKRSHMRASSTQLKQTSRDLRSTAWLDGLRGFAALLVCICGIRDHEHFLNKSRYTGVTINYGPINRSVLSISSRIPSAMKINAILLRYPVYVYSFLVDTSRCPASSSSLVTCCPTSLCSTFMQRTIRSFLRTLRQLSSGDGCDCLPLSRLSRSAT